MSTRLVPRVPFVDGVEHHFVALRGIRFHVAEAGAGPPVLLLHGFPLHWYAWRHVIPRLSNEYRLLCLDLRGFGWSDAPPTGYDTDTLVADVRGVLDALGLERVRLIGQEWGGRVGFRFCLIAPERVSHFLALNALHPWPNRRQLLHHAWRQWYTAVVEYPVVGSWVLRNWPAFTRYLLRRGVIDQSIWTSEELEEFVRPLREPERARAAQALHWQYVLHDIPRLALGRDRQQRLHVPTRILFGANDYAVSPDALAGGERFADDLQMRVIPQCGQSISHERPDLVAEAARELFRRLESPASDRRCTLRRHGARVASG